MTCCAGVPHIAIPRAAICATKIAKKNLAGCLNEEEIRLMLRHQKPADYCLRHAGQIVGKLYRQQHIDAIGLRIFDERLTRLAGVQAASERISTTPLPFAYTLLTHRSACV